MAQESDPHADAESLELLEDGLRKTMRSRRQAALQDVGWTVIAIVFDDVRHRAWDFVARIDQHLRHARAA